MIRIDSGKRRPAGGETDAGQSFGRLVNKAVQEAPEDCDLVVVMDGGVLPTSPDWLETMAETVLDPRTGAVSPATYYQDGRVRHAGMAFGFGEVCSYVSRSERPATNTRDAFFIDRLRMLREVSVVSRHCLMVRRSVFDAHGGFDEHLGIEAVDIDFCLRLRSVGMPIFLDGRVMMTSTDDYPRWSRSLSPRDVLVLIERHKRRVLELDEFWLRRTTPNDIASIGVRDTIRPNVRPLVVNKPTAS